MASAGLSLKTAPAIAYHGSSSSSKKDKQKIVHGAGDLFTVNRNIDLKLIKLTDNYSSLDEVAFWIEKNGGIYAIIQELKKEKKFYHILKITFSLYFMAKNQLVCLH